MKQPIPDYLRSGLKIIFVGFNPSLRSGSTGHHYANPHNRFWRILHQAGLTPYQLKPEDDGTLLELGYGLTNIVARPTQAATDITKEEYAQGRKLLWEKITLYRPQVVCYVGKGVYQAYTRKTKMPWGIQDEPVVAGVIDFVAPSSSGLVRIPINEVVEIYSNLKDLVR